MRFFKLGLHLKSKTAVSAIDHKPIACLSTNLISLDRKMDYNECINTNLWFELEPELLFEVLLEKMNTFWPIKGKS